MQPSSTPRMNIMTQSGNVSRIEGGGASPTQLKAGALGHDCTPLAVCNWVTCIPVAICSLQRQFAKTTKGNKLQRMATICQAAVCNLHSLPSSCSATLETDDKRRVTGHTFWNVLDHNRLRLKSRFIQVVMPL